MKFENKNHKPFTYVNNNVKQTIQSEEVEEKEKVNEIEETDNLETTNFVDIETNNITNNEEVIEKPVIHNIKGIVTDCERLNIRSNPDINSNVLKVINNGDKLDIIDLNESSEFYKILIDNVEGYCMKKFITTINE